MVVSVLGVIEYSTNIDNDVKLLDDLLVPGSNNNRVCELFSSKQHLGRKDLITVESLRMRTNQLLVLTQLRVLEVILNEVSLIISADNLQLGSDHRLIVVKIDELLLLLHL